MKTEIKKLPGSQIEILFGITPEEFKDSIEKAILNLGRDLEIEGFRKGQAPKEVVIQKIGQDRILTLATRLAAEENYFREIFANKFEVIAQPDIEILSEVSFDKGLTFKATFAAVPEITLPDYRKIASGTKRKEIFIKEKEIDDALAFLQKSRAKFIFENRPAKKRDFVEIEFQSPKIETGLKKKDNFILGEGHFVAGFEENLEGMAPGQEKEFSLKFPENYLQKELAGNLVNFKVKMNSVQKMELPEINDEWAKGLGNFENLNSLRDNIKKGIKMEKENFESQRIRGEILEKITKETKVEIPEVLLEAEKKRMLGDLKNLVSERFRIPFEDYLVKAKKTEAELLKSFSTEAEKKIKYSLVLRRISKREKIEVPEEELKTAISEFLRNYPNVEKAKKELDLEKLRSYYEEVIRNEKTLKMLESLVPKL